MSFEEHKFLILVKSNLPIFSLVVCVLSTFKEETRDKELLGYLPYNQVSSSDLQEAKNRASKNMNSYLGNISTLLW